MSNKDIYIPETIQLYKAKYNDKNLLTAEQLNHYRSIKEDYFNSKELKERIILKLKTLGISSEKLLNTKTQALTDDELRYKRKLDSINQDLEGFQAWILKEEEYIKKKFLKLKPHHNKIMTNYYINVNKWSVVCISMFNEKPDFKVNYETYRRTIMGWRKSALKQLLKANPEEKTATVKLKRIKKLCKTLKTTKSQDFIKQILTIIG